MKVVGIKQLNARLSEYIRLAGEVVLVTKRGEVVAEIRPARRQTPIAHRLEELLDALAASGEVTRAAQPKGDWTWRSRDLGLPSGAAQVLIDDLRQGRSSRH
jgi:antitoxin (DNA-binding transcriptional repressor) of toxin-antitoxin stability system